MVPLPRVSSQFMMKMTPASLASRRIASSPGMPATQHVHKLIEETEEFLCCGQSHPTPKPPTLYCVASFDPIGEAKYHIWAHSLFKHQLVYFSYAKLVHDFECHSLDRASGNSTPPSIHQGLDPTRSPTLPLHHKVFVDKKPVLKTVTSMCMSSPHSTLLMCSDST
jgi:hypothetical protein